METGCLAAMKVRTIYLFWDLILLYYIFIRNKLERRDKIYQQDRILPALSFSFQKFSVLFFIFFGI